MKLAPCVVGLLLGGVLASCAPAQTAPVPELRAQPNISSVSFYPSQPGLTWTYLPQGEAIDRTPYVLRALGPTIFKGQTVSGFAMTGRGAEQTWFRQIDASGVKLLGFTKPGVLVNLEPAWQELPPSGQLRVGAAWQGSTQVTVMDSARNTVVGQGTLQYRYDVQDRRQITTPAGQYDVFVVTRRVTDDLGGLFPAVQQMYFAPYIGEVRTYEDLLLAGQNYSRPASTEPAPAGTRP
ncbi:hypothetical protein [Deinococcus radiophilus]|uniref:Lipoprotein n=1 Tax=Deinococcus radiophilus TaxID=32062 RepID=A0A431W5Z6_9DEIO|nr:hypothetical protein [Deinococcus radiophilus]RTR30800.1 hypothetical protein EJ104_00675 [Deinococcus radiophilus]UFA49382.1 hypothetical protein LMT64_05545 [Deinococcus radiophilus]